MTLLRKRNFLLLWLAQLISMTVLSASNYALLILISQVAPHQEILLALAMIAFSLPAVLFGAPAGVFVDRRNKKSVLFYSNCLRALATLGFVISLLLNYTWLLPTYLLTFLISGIGQFFTPAEGASIAMLVDEDELMHALSLFQVTFMLSNALGLIILGPLFVIFMPTIYVLGHPILPIVSLYILMGVLYVICAGLIALIPSRNFIEPRRRKTRTGDLAAESLGVWQTLWHEMLQAWTFIRRRPHLFEAVIQLSFAGVLLQVIGVLAIPLVRDLLHMDSTLMPVVFAPAGVGLVLSSLIMPRVTKALGKSRTIFIGCMALALMIILLPLTNLLPHQVKLHSIPVDPLQVAVVGVIMFLAGVALNFVNITSSTAMQEQTPEWIKGRVLALQLVLYNTCSIPVLLLNTGIAQISSLPVVLYFLAICITLFGFWGFFYERKPHPHAYKEKEVNSQDQKDQGQKEPESIIG
jgi:MFS family permease